MGNKAIDLNLLSLPRVVIAIGCQDTVKAKTLNTLMGIMLSTKKAMITGFFMRQGGDIVSARGAGVEFAIEKKATHIFFVDSDMSFPEDTLDRLLAHGKEITTVEYNRRKLPPESVTTPLEKRSDKELYKAQNIGGGCLLIKLSIFEKLKQPWFNFGRKGTKVVIGEDTWFANTARDAGFDSWIDPTLQVKHIGEYEY